MSEDRIVSLDRMRYVKNKASANLALLAIVFDVLYFVGLYRTNDEYYYTFMMGISVIYNLIFMLMAFLSSEGVKNYKKGFSWLLFALGVGQIVRIFILPMQAHEAIGKLGNTTYMVMDDRQFAFSIACLVLSAVCCFVSGIINIDKKNRLDKHVASLKGSAA
ncbi:MAG: hypothetical protein E7327_06710 [Clostridiales bacterium]|nr:hypothetical protein [Clostridiales bacterium]